MGWEQRGNQIYYYQKEWRNGRCVSVYVGSGFVGEMTANLEETERNKREFEKQVLQAEIQNLAPIDNQIDELNRQIKSLVERILISKGFYKTKSREWRLRKRMSETVIEASGESLDILNNNNKPEPSNKDKKALRKLFDENPQIWQNIADFQSDVFNTVVKKFSKAYLTHASYREKLKSMRDNLGWETSNELEKVLIEQVCLCWVRHNFIEMAHAEKLSEKGVSLQVGAYFDKLLMQSQKRYIKACESLAKVRKLLAETQFYQSKTTPFPTSWRMDENELPMINKQLTDGQNPTF